MKDSNIVYYLVILNLIRSHTDNFEKSNSGRHRLKDPGCAIQIWSGDTVAEYVIHVRRFSAVFINTHYPSVLKQSSNTTRLYIRFQ